MYSVGNLLMVIFHISSCGCLKEKFKKAFSLKPIKRKGSLLSWNFKSCMYMECLAAGKVRLMNVLGQRTLGTWAE